MVAAVKAFWLSLSAAYLTWGHDCNDRYAHQVSLDYPGDIKLGALFPIHKKGEIDGAQCGEIQREDGIQPLEAMLFTLDEINREAFMTKDGYFVAV